MGDASPEIWPMFTIGGAVWFAEAGPCKCAAVALPDSPEKVMFHDISLVSESNVTDAEPLAAAAVVAEEGGGTSCALSIDVVHTKAAVAACAIGIMVPLEAVIIAASRSIEPKPSVAVNIRRW
jgi:hypothetical protein